MTETQTVIYLQTVETKVEAENKINAKGDKQPEVRVCVLRKLESKEDVFKIISSDIEEVVKKVKESLEKLK